MEKSRLIYIADDEDNIRIAIKTFLESEGYNVIAFADGESLLKRFSVETPDLVILDVMMPGMSGFEVCSELRKTSTVPIIMLTARDSDIDYATGLNLGSDDYFTKPFSAISLVMRVKAMFRRIDFERKHDQEYSELLRFGNIAIDVKSKTVTANGSVLNLSPNEYEVLKYLFEHKDKAVSRDELLENIWGFSSEIETRATDDTVRRLRKKLEPFSTQIENVWGYGFRLKERDNIE